MELPKVAASPIPVSSVSVSMKIRNDHRHQQCQDGILKCLNFSSVAALSLGSNPCFLHKKWATTHNTRQMKIPGRKPAINRSLIEVPVATPYWMRPILVGMITPWSAVL